MHKRRKYLEYIFSLSILFFLPSLVYASQDVVEEWKNLIENYKTHMVVGEWNGAIQSAERLLDLDPSDSEAKFYLVYALKKSGVSVPNWVGPPSSWAYGSVNDRFYVNLAKDMGFGS